MAMREITTFQLPDEIVQPFTISSADNTLVVCGKEHTFVLQLKYKHFSDDGSINYVLSRFKCSTARPTGQLLAHEANLYNAADNEERKQIMLDQTIFPNIAKVYISNVQSWISPAGALPERATEHLVANITNMGQLTIYRQDEECLSNWSCYADVSAAWGKHFYGGEPIEGFQRLQMMVYETVIISFCWQDKVQQHHPVHFVFATKSAKIVLCSLTPGAPKVEHVNQLVEAAAVLKYVSVNAKDHFLLAGGRSGRVIMFRLHIRNGQKSLKRVASLLDEDLTASAIECEVDSKTGRLLLVVVKGSFLLALNVTTSGKTLGSGAQDLGHFMITGLQQLEPRKYIVSTMEGAIFLITIDRAPDGGLKLRHQRLASDLNVGSYGLYGVTATHTRSCWLFLGFPTKRYDHLILRTPTSVFFTKFSMREAIQVLRDNDTLRMTEYYDAAEVVRYDGFKSGDTLKELEKVELKPELNDACSYQLKLQLICLSAKLTYQSRRNKATTEILHNQLQFLCTMIEVINASRALGFLAELAKRKATLNPLQQSAVLCLRNFIHNIVEDAFPGDFEYVHLGLKPELEEVLRRTETTPRLSYETCHFCDAQIPPNRCTCRKDHPVFRCVTTKIQIPLDEDEITCEMCQRYTLRPCTLAEVFEEEKGIPCPVDHTRCCVCDVPFKSTN